MFRNAIEELPANDSPELFGLHSNADLSYRRLQVRSWGGACGQGAAVSGGGRTRAG